MHWRRRLRKIRLKSNKALPIAIFCFSVGVFFGWNSNAGITVAKATLGDDQVQKRSNELEVAIVPGVLGRKKLSIKSEIDAAVFTRLPENLENNIYPPRSPSQKFTLVPTKVIERNRANENGRSQYFMLFIVKTSPLHVSRRDVIRKTWGAVKVIDGLLLNTIFVVGDVGKNQPVQDMLEKESRDHGDILQIDVSEGYRNLPSKVLSAMQWLISKSSDIASDFYTFTDDDCVMNIAWIADFFGQLAYVTETKESRPIKSDSAATPNVKKIQSIELYKKATVNEVTLPRLAGNRNNDSPKLEFDSKVVVDQSKMQPQKFDGNSDLDLKENLEIYGEMHQNNPKLQVEVTRKDGDETEKLTLSSDEAELFEILKSANPTFTLNETLTNYNSAYKHNADNLTNYIKLSLRRQDDPTAIFRQKIFSPDTIYCGFSYDARGRPIRKVRSKYSVTPDIYSPNIYPPFCHGGMYTMTGNRMASIYGISTVTDWKKFHLEDVLITGILREKTGVPESKYIRIATTVPKKRSLMYYAWDSGPKVIMKMARKWKYFTVPLFRKRLIMEAVKDGRPISWNNYDRVK